MPGGRAGRHDARRDQGHVGDLPRASPAGSATIEQRDRFLAFHAPLILATMFGVWLIGYFVAFGLLLWPATGSFAAALRESGSSLLTLGFASTARGRADRRRLHRRRDRADRRRAPDRVPAHALRRVQPPRDRGHARRRPGRAGRRGGPSSWLGAGGQLTDRRAPGVLPPVGALGRRRLREPRELPGPDPVPFAGPAGELADRAARGHGRRGAVSRAVALGGRPIQARLAIQMGFTCMRQLADTIGMPYDSDPKPDAPIELTYEEFDTGHRTPPGRSTSRWSARPEEAWPHFRGWRVNYESIVYRLAFEIDAPPALWSGPRRGGLMAKPPVRPPNRRPEDPEGLSAASCPCRSKPRDRRRRANVRTRSRTSGLSCVLAVPRARTHPSAARRRPRPTLRRRRRPRSATTPPTPPSAPSLPRRAPRPTLGPEVHDITGLAPRRRTRPWPTEQGNAVRLISILVPGLNRGSGMRRTASGGCPGWQPRRPRRTGTSRSSASTPFAWGSRGRTSNRPRPRRARTGMPVHHYNPAYLHAVDATVRGFASHGVAVVLDMVQVRWSPAFHAHPAAAGQRLQVRRRHAGVAVPERRWRHGDGPGRARRSSPTPSRWTGLADAWTFLARRYAKQPMVVGADILNEPYDLLAVALPGHRVAHPGRPEPQALLRDGRRGDPRRRTRSCCSSTRTSASAPAEPARRSPAARPAERRVLGAHVPAVVDRRRRAGRCSRSTRRGRRVGRAAVARRVLGVRLHRPRRGPSPNWAADLRAFVLYCRAHDIGWTIASYSSNRLLIKGTTTPKPEHPSTSSGRDPERARNTTAGRGSSGRCGRRRRSWRTRTTIAVVGASRDPGKSAHSVPRQMQLHGWRIIPVNPFADELFGEKAYRTLADIPEPVDIVDVFRPSEDAAERGAAGGGDRREGALAPAGHRVRRGPRGSPRRPGWTSSRTYCIAVERALSQVHEADREPRS